MPRRSTGPRLKFEALHRSDREVYIIHDWRGGKRVRRSTGTDDLGEAQERLREYLAEATPRPVGRSDPAAVLIATVLAIYGEEHAPHTAIPKDIGANIAALLPFWGARPVSAIRKKTCLDYIDWRTKQRAKRGDGKGKVKLLNRFVSESTAAKEIDTLSAACGYSVSEGYLASAPPVTKPERGPGRQRWLTRAEAARLLRAARNQKRSRHYLPYVILLGLYHGQRKRAMTALQWLPNTKGGHVDLEHGIVDFRPLEKKETNKRRARVRISRRALTFLRYLRQRTSQYVFERERETRSGRTVTLKRGPIVDVKKAFANACETAGLEDVNLHTLVHTCCTWLMHAGVPIAEAAGYVNKSSAIFEKTYAHHHPDHMQRAREALERRRA